MSQPKRPRGRQKKKQESNNKRVERQMSTLQYDKIPMQKRETQEVARGIIKVFYEKDEVDKESNNIDTINNVQKFSPRPSKGYTL